MTTEHFLPITLRMVVEPLSSTGHTKRGLRERTGGLNCPRENKFEVIPELTILNLPIPLTLVVSSGTQ